MAETSGCIVFGFNLIWSNHNSKLHVSARIGKNLTVVGDFNPFETILQYVKIGSFAQVSSVKRKKYIVETTTQNSMVLSHLSHQHSPDTSCTLRGSTRNLHLEMSDIIWHHRSSFICPYIYIIMCTCNLINMMCKTVWITSPEIIQ